MLEKMNDFFAARVDGYDEHMINNVEGCREGYKVMASLVPETTIKILDLGCGTGLELDEIFKLHPDAEVVGIDMTAEMLSELKKKHGDKKLNVICGDYFEEPFGSSVYDCVISFETMHHFSKESKTELYKKIYNSLKKEGVYIECDYMIESDEEEEYFFSELKRLKIQEGIDDNVICHFDTPCTVDNQIKMFCNAGFSQVTKHFRMGGTTIITGVKQ